MSNERSTPASQSGNDNAQRQETGSREGDPRKRDQQDMRTLATESESAQRKDDPSRAPESGTP